MLQIDNIEVYSSIKELPINRYKAFQMHLIHDSGIGNTIADIDVRIARLSNFIVNEKREDSIEELQNFRLTFYSLLNGIDFKSRSFACLIKSINGNSRDNITDDGLDETAAMINISCEALENYLADIKKNLIANSN